MRLLRTVFMVVIVSWIVGPLSRDCEWNGPDTIGGFVGVVDPRMLTPRATGREFTHPSVIVVSHPLLNEPKITHFPLTGREHPFINKEYPVLPFLLIARGLPFYPTGFL